VSEASTGKASGLSATGQRRLRSLAFWEALQTRYPLGSRWELVRPAASVVAANVVTARALFRGEMRPWELVVLVALEALAFSVIAWIQNFSVPPEARADHGEKKPTPLQRLGTLTFGLFWLLFVYGLVFGGYLREIPEWGALARDPFAFLGRSAIRWPLAISIGGAILDAVADRQFWRHRGGTFVSTPGFTGVARWLTLIFGAIPFFVPFAAGAGVIAAVAKLVEKRGGPRPKAHWALFLIPVLAILLFVAMGRLIQAGEVGWATGYVSAKLAMELLLLGVPLLARRGVDDDRAAIAKTAAVKSKSKPKRRS
jgi:hypothetical protein